MSKNTRSPMSKAARKLMAVSAEYAEAKKIYTRHLPSRVDEEAETLNCCKHVAILSVLHSDFQGEGDLGALIDVIGRNFFALHFGTRH